MTRIVVCCDGLDPRYLDTIRTPNWDTIASSGTSGICSAVVPSLTNVNNVSIATSSFPNEHGITGNTYFDRETNQREYMENPSYLRKPTRFTEFQQSNEESIALVAKEKLEQMVGQGCVATASAENPPEWLSSAVGDPPGIYSGKASSWLLNAAVWVAEHKSPDWLYVSTTDVIPHKHAPDEEEARTWLTTLDEGLGRLNELADGFLATADHGMRDKTLAIDVEALLAESDIDSVVIRLIRDKHVYHHQNLGGAAYVYLNDDELLEAIDLLQSTDGIEMVLRRGEAVDKFSLPPDRIGDLMVLGTEESVFGPVDEGIQESVELRSHGSHHEQTVPFVCSNDTSISNNSEAFSALSANSAP